MKILFVGNSLTYSHDVPGLVKSLAARHALRVSTLSVARANFSLEDHWYNGISSEIRRLRPDVVVMQQGPSSTEDNRAHLVRWSQRLAEVIREVGAEPALYMVWPDISRSFAFPAVEASYAEAAAAVSGRLLPAGTTWLMAWEQDSDLALYGSDGFHPTYLGALAAAQTIFAGLFDVDALSIPALEDGLSTVRLDQLRAAVAASLLRWQQ